METSLRHISQVPVQVGQPASVSNPVKADLFAGKHETQLAKTVGVTQFGVNHVKLEPGSSSSLRHWHESEDEFVFVLAGELTLVDENGEHAMSAGSFAGFPASRANAHHLKNKSNSPATFIVVGTRKRGEEIIHYPDDGIGPIAVMRNESGDRVSG